MHIATIRTGATKVRPMTVTARTRWDWPTVSTSKMRQHRRNSHRDHLLKGDGCSFHDVADSCIAVFLAFLARLGRAFWYRFLNDPANVLKNTQHKSMT